MVRAFIALGSNLGDRALAIHQAVERMPDEELLVRRTASIYRTAPVGPAGQPEYYNTVTEVQTTKSPEALLDHLKALERALGRTDSVRWGPRVIDLDILLYGTAVLRGPRLVVPHPEMHRRAFVLVPLAELAAELDVPGRDANVHTLLSQLSFEPSEIVQLPSP